LTRLLPLKQRLFAVPCASVPATNNTLSAVFATGVVLNTRVPFVKMDQSQLFSTVGGTWLFSH